MDCKLVTPRVERWLRHGRPSRILHLFDEVLNLVNDYGEVISLASPSVGAGPFTMSLSEDFVADLANVDLDDEVAINYGTETLIIGPLSIDSSGASLWEPRPAWSRLRRQRIESWPAARPLPSEIEDHLNKLLGGISGEDIGAIQDGAGSLAGLGNGLTPSGDDVLLGVIFALWVWYPRQAWIQLIAETAVSRTTRLSAAFLNAAADGEATNQWHDLVNGREDAVERILAIGHSSGAEAWAGFLRAGNYLRDKALIGDG